MNVVAVPAGRGPAQYAICLKGIVWRGVVNASQRPPLQAAQNLSQVFMGINLKCASCHDSFIDAWKLDEAYAFANCFSEDGKLDVDLNAAARESSTSGG